MRESGFESRRGCEKARPRPAPMQRSGVGACPGVAKRSRGGQGTCSAFHVRCSRARGFKGQAMMNVFSLDPLLTRDGLCKCRQRSFSVKKSGGSVEKAKKHKTTVCVSVWHHSVDYVQFNMLLLPDAVFQQPSVPKVLVCRRFDSFTRNVGVTQW